MIDRLSIYYKYLEDCDLAKEGNVGQFERQRKVLLDSVRARAVHQTEPFYGRFMEIGFNVGHSAALFLDQEMEVVSFDLGGERTVQAKEMLDMIWPDQHELILGDSMETVPGYRGSWDFDLVFIDGGHSFEVATADLNHVLERLAPGRVVAMDDVVTDPREEWTIGPSRAWANACDAGKVRHWGDIALKPGARGMVLGEVLEF